MEKLAGQKYRANRLDFEPLLFDKLSSIAQKIRAYIRSKGASNQNIALNGLFKAIEEVESGNFDANLGGHLYKKQIRFDGQGKSGSGRTIICYKKGNRAIFIHGFAKNEKSNLSKKELNAFKEFSKILLGFSEKEMTLAVENGNFIEVNV